MDKRLQSIDLMKGIAMIMIILVHYEQSFNLCKWFWYLQMGCPIFFVCSGFGIMFLIRKRYNGVINKKNYKSFYLSRLKTLAPGWYLAFAIIFLTNTIFIANLGHSSGFGTNRGIVDIVCNLLFLHGFLPFCNTNVMPGGWYIGATAILYLITPFILFCLRKFKSPRLFFVLSSMTDMLIWLVLLYVLQDFWAMGEGYHYFVFLVHYPSYLLGIIVYNDLRNNLLSQKQAHICLWLSFPVIAVAVYFFYAIPSYYGGRILSSWSTAFYTSLILYYLINIEQNGELKINFFLNIISNFGKNSYAIFLLHAFYVWPFISLINKGMSLIGVSIMNKTGFIIMMPIVLTLCYITGIIFTKIIHFITRSLFGEHRTRTVKA